MNVYVTAIVEGHTEQQCVERLLHRIWTELLHRPERLQVLELFRDDQDTLVHQDGRVLAEIAQKAFSKLQRKARKDSEARSLLLILLDAESDCPAELAPRLLQTAQLARNDADIACVLAKRMFENWIVAGASTLAGVNGLPDPLHLPNNPEDLNGAAWLDQQLRSQKRTRSYKKTVDAAVFVQKMSLEQCRAHSSSFDKLCRELILRLPPSETSTDPATTAP